MAMSTTSNIQPQTSNNAVSINNNVVKPESLQNENKNLILEVAVEPNETPVVSAISDSPVIVPKMPNNKQLQKNCDQPLALDTNKNQPNKQHKQNNKSKPVVPEEIERVSDSVNVGASQSAPITVTTAIPASTAVTPASLPPSSAAFQAGPPAAAAAPAPSPAAAPVPAPAPVAAPLAASVAAPLVTSAPHYVVPAPQPQRIRENRTRLKSEDKEKAKERETHPEIEMPNFPVKANGPTSAVGE